jgi:hypothetical protein
MVGRKSLSKCEKPSEAGPIHTATFPSMRMTRTQVLVAVGRRIARRLKSAAASGIPWVSVVVISVGLASCGTFQLGNVKPQAGKTADQEKLDILVCKDQAHNAAASAGQQTKEFLLGLTLIGTPVAYESDKAKQRAVFKSCMEAKGYVVEAAPEGTQDTLSKLDQAPPAALPVPGVDSLKIDWPAGFESKAPTDAQRSSGVVAVAVNRAADIGVQVIADRHQGVADVSTYAQSKRAALLSRLGSGSAGDITLTEVGGRKAFRCEGGGIANGIHIKGSQTIIEGTDQLITVIAWTSEANWSHQADLIRELPARVTGIH